MADPRKKRKRGAVDGSPLGGVGAAISAWTADQCSQSFGQALLPEEVREHAAQVRAAKGRELVARGEFKVSAPVNAGVPSKAAWGSMWVNTRDMVDGKRDVKER